MLRVWSVNVTSGVSGQIVYTIEVDGSNEAIDLLQFHAMNNIPLYAELFNDATFGIPVDLTLIEFSISTEYTEHTFGGPKAVRRMVTIRASG